VTVKRVAIGSQPEPYRLIGPDLTQVYPYLPQYAWLEGPTLTYRPPPPPSPGV
jgi:hypothetical protein